MIGTNWKISLRMHSPIFLKMEFVSILCLQLFVFQRIHIEFLLRRRSRYGYGYGYGYGSRQLQEVLDANASVRACLLL